MNSTYSKYAHSLLTALLSLFFNTLPHSAWDSSLSAVSPITLLKFCQVGALVVWVATDIYGVFLNGTSLTTLCF